MLCQENKTGGKKKYRAMLDDSAELSRNSGILAKNTDCEEGGGLAIYVTQEWGKESDS